MSSLSPSFIARLLTAEQRDLLLSGPLDFDEAATLPGGLFELDCWLDENCEECLFWEITDLGRAVREVVRRTR
jgi:hypothetical protein